VPRVIYAREDVTIKLDKGEPGPKGWPDIQNLCYLGELNDNTELWLIQGKLIKVVK